MNDDGERPTLGDFAKTELPHELRSLYDRATKTADIKPQVIDRLFTDVPVRDFEREFANVARTHGGVRFDWDGDDEYDDRAQLPTRRGRFDANGRLVFDEDQKE